MIALTSAILLPFCDVYETAGPGMISAFQPGFKNESGWGWQEKVVWVLVITIWGGLGSVLDSVLGGWFQATVIDARTGKVIEGAGGKKVSLPFILEQQRLIIAGACCWIKDASKQEERRAEQAR